MSKLVRELIDAGGADAIIHVEVDGDSYEEDLQVAGRHGGTRGASGDTALRPFEKGLELVRTTAGAVAKTMLEVAEAARPNELEVQFAIKFTTQVGAFIAKSGTDAQLQVKLKWVKGS